MEETQTPINLDNLNDGSNSNENGHSAHQAIGQENPVEKDDESETKGVTTNDIVYSIIQACVGESIKDEDKDKCKSLIKKYLKQITELHACSKDYNIVILYDNGAIVKTDADSMYNAVTHFIEKKPILLILYSPGGSPGSAYLIGKLLREYSNGKFTIAIPRMAKSAATLICCAANEIHMGSLSELGPIDPQIDEMPALGLKYSVEHIAELVKRYPASSEMFAKYLNLSLKLIHIGYFERVAESALQYAENLLSTRGENTDRDIKQIAKDLVYKYKDHGFVIDKIEADKIFGGKIIKMNTPEYDLANSLYESFAFLTKIFAYADHGYYHIGSLDTDIIINKKTTSD